MCYDPPMNLTEIQKNNLAESLQKLIRIYLDENPKRSVLSLSRECLVSETSLRRILNDTKVPSPTNVYKLMSFLQSYAEQSKSSNLKQKITESFEFNLKDFEMLGIQEKNKLIGQIEQYLNTKTKRLLFIKISTVDSMPKEKIIEDFGMIGFNDAEALAEEGLLIKTNLEFAISQQYKSHSYSNLMTKIILQEVIDQYYKSELTTNYLSLQINTTSVEGYNQIMNLQKKYYDDLKKILNEQKGKVPFFQIQCLDTLTVDKYRKE